VQLVPVDEASRGDIADDGIVVPAVPQAAGDLDRVGRLVEQVDILDIAPAEQLGLVFGSADPHLPAGPAMRDEVKCGNGFGDMKGFRVRHRGDRDQPDVTGHGGDSGGDQHGVRPAREPARFDLRTAAALWGEGVVERHEVQQPTLGGDGEVRPVPAAGHGPVVRAVPPGLGVPAKAVQRDSHPQLPGHASSLTKAIGKTSPSAGSGSSKRV
jgi:hypothetical protein